jgi:hypothetical protein
MALLCTVLPGTMRGAIYAGVGNEGFNPGAVINLDPATGLGALLPGSTGGPGITGLAFSPSGRLFGTTRFRSLSPTTLREYDPATGAVLPLSSLVRDATGAEIQIGDLSFHPGAGTLYGLDIGGNLHTIDTVTGTTQLVGNPGQGRGGIAFSPAGVLYMTGGITLNVLDPATGVALFSRTLNNFYDGLAFDAAAGLLWGAVGGFDQVYTIDPVTGTETLIGSVGIGKISDLDFVASVPEPQTVFLLGSACALIAIRRRAYRSIG